MALIESVKVPREQKVQVSLRKAILFLLMALSLF